MHQFCSHVVLGIILTFPGRWLSYVGNAYDWNRHYRHCTLGCIAYSRLLCRSSLLWPLSKVPGTQSRRPSCLNALRPSRHLQLRHLTEKEIHRMWGVVGVYWTVWSGCFMSYCRGCGLGLPSFLVSPIYTPSWCPHIRLNWLVHDLMLQWLWCWFALISRLSETCSASLPNDVLIFQFLRRRAIYYWCTDSRPIFFPNENDGSSWNFWELAIGERGQLEVKDEKLNMPLVVMVAIVAEVYGAVCQLYFRFWNTTLATWRRCGHQAYTWYGYVLQKHVVDNAGRHYIDCGREGLINDLSFFSYWDLNESF